ncbi:DUF2750 domain-containing protein [Vibrio sp. TH_r3]|uniref:DUF2750 domain-containing protein n=1 Tax=Vibrio sp. TH_r3 TaxID=3082084 RepID=UPI0029546733|nr:DUF2750 domain-containing protein [Vibrio sp. TH_r3]MDV7102977.1 DUF2750 domain-containing protein [Vibrio sp. TH_r3]
MVDKLDNNAINNLDAEQRLKYCIKEIATNRQVWILTDEHGCVMLNTEDEDCVPVWPSQAFAAEWSTGEWENCVAESISVAKWHSRWTHGLADDELAIVVFPNIDQEGVVLFPDEFDFELKKQTQKIHKS